MKKETDLVLEYIASTNKDTNQKVESVREEIKSSNKDTNAQLAEIRSLIQQLNKSEWTHKWVATKATQY